MPHVFLLRSRPLNPFVRVLLTLAGAAVVALLVIFGAFVLLALLAVGLGALALNHWRAWRGKPASKPAPPPAARDPRVLEGQFSEVRDETASR